jgi:hypothetical protein
VTNSTVPDTVGSHGIGVPAPAEAAMFTGYCNPLLVVNDSDHDFDPMCLADCNASNSLTCTYDCSGRLRTVFEPTCVREIEARQTESWFKYCS